MPQETLAFEVTAQKDSASFGAIMKMVGEVTAVNEGVDFKITRQGSEKEVHRYEIKLETTTNPQLHRARKSLEEYLTREGKEQGIKKVTVPTTSLPVEINFGTRPAAGKFISELGREIGKWEKEYNVQFDAMESNLGESGNSMEDWKVKLQVSGAVSGMKDFYNSLGKLAKENSGEVTSEQAEIQGFAARVRNKSSNPPPSSERSR